MLDSFTIATAVAIFLGFLAGLGIGGGSLLILWLTMVLGMEYSAARNINLLFFLPAAILSSWLRSRKGVFSWKCLLPGIAAGCISAVLFSRLGQKLDLTLVKKGFGILLLLAAYRELRWQPSVES